MPEIVFTGTPENARRAVNATAAAWGAQWNGEEHGGELVLPLVAALRRGVVRGHLEIAPAPEGVRVRFAESERGTELNRGAVAVLAVGALSGIALMLWPFFPRLLAAAPLAAVLAFLAWFLVVSRLRMSGPEEFLEAVRQAAGESS